jgi:hypothetical protein
MGSPMRAPYKKAGIGFLTGKEYEHVEETTCLGRGKTVVSQGMGMGRARPSFD